jgi:excisionase family DNA binding protein
VATVKTNEKKILTVAEVAAATRLSESRIRQLIRSGTIPSAQIVPGGQHRVHAEDVARLLEPGQP